jgi:excisionase family DNA binding protein
MKPSESASASSRFPDLLWNEDDLAAAISISVKKVQQLAREGLLPAFKVGRKWRFDPDAVRSWVKSNASQRKSSQRTGTARVKQYGQFNVYRHSRKRS